MADKVRIYWDACVWISMVNGYAAREANCLDVIRRARDGELEIWTSSLSLAEVFKAKVNGDHLALEEVKDQAFADYIEQDFVQEVQVDHDVGMYARKLLRQFGPLKKPNDGIHLATAVLNNCDELHTYDSENLIPLSGQVECPNGKLLLIREPPPPIQPVLDLVVNAADEGGVMGNGANTEALKPAADPAADSAVVAADVGNDIDGGVSPDQGSW